MALTFAACPPATPLELEFSSRVLSMQVGEQREVRVRTVDGPVANATFTSSDERMVEVSVGANGSAVLVGRGVGNATVTARAGNLQAELPVTVFAAVVTLSRIELTPANATVPKGMQVQLVATGLYSDGTREELSAQATWSSSDVTVATVDASGLVSGVAEGTATMTALLNGVRGQLAVMVTGASVVALEVAPGQLSLARGTTGSLRATAALSDASTTDVTGQVTWASSNAAIATIDAAGSVRAVGLGVATLTATLGPRTASAQVTVTDAALTALNVTAGGSLPRGLTLQLTATGTFSDGSVQDLSAQATWASSNESVAPVSSSGLVTGLALGTASVTVTLGTFLATTDVTVTAAALQRLELTPATQLTLPLGVTRELVATGFFSDTSTQDLTSQVVWTSSALLVATVSNATGSVGRVTPGMAGTSTITASRAGVSASLQLTVTSASVTSITVTPANPMLARGLTQRLIATGTFSDNSTQDLTAQATWASDAAGIASVSNAAGDEGLVTANALGTATISAAFGGSTGQTSVSVTAATPVRLEIVPATVSLAKGRTLQLTARLVLTDATTSDVTSQATWASATPFVATLSSGGLLSALNVGNATVTTRFMGFVAQRTVTVTSAVIDSLAISPNPLVLAKGRAGALTATATFTDGTTQDVTTQVTWQSSAPTVLSVSNASGQQGNVVALLEGPGTVSVSLSGLIGTGAFTVDPPAIVSLALSPLASSVAKGLGVSFTATATLSDTTTRNATAEVTWASSAMGVATISNTMGSQGQATSLTEGTTTITATAGTVSAMTSLTVTAPVFVGVSVSPTTVSLALGEGRQLSATATRSDATTLDVTSSGLWASSSGNVTVNSGGFASSVAQGTADVTASYAGFMATVQVTVTAPRLVSIAVSPMNPSVPKGRTQAFVATGTYTDLSSSNLTASAVWASSDGAVASVSAPGQVLTLTLGTSTVSATVGSISGAATLTVVAPVLESLVLSGRTSFAVGTTTRLVATGTYSDATTQDLSASALWSSDAPAVATPQGVSGARGLVSGLTVGSANVQAQVGSVSTSAAVKVRAHNAAYVGRCAPGLVLSQLFGGGGNAGAPFRNDYVELHNAGPTPRALTGMSIQYAPATGTTWASNVRALPDVTLEPGAYFLVQLNANGTTAAAITPDFTVSPALNISGSDGKVALVSNAVGLPAAACPDPATTVDFVGFGAADCGEGTVASAMSSTTALLRGVDACRDGNVNVSDVTVGTPAPRSTATAPVLCSCEQNETDAPSEVAYCNLQFPTSQSLTQGTLSPLVFGRVYEAGVTEPGGAAANVTVQVGLGPSMSNPLSSPGAWSWWPAGFNVQIGNDDEYQAAFVAPSAGSWSYTTRASLDGVNWTLCDVNGAGRNAGLTFEATQLGALTTTP